MVTDERVEKGSSLLEQCWIEIHSPKTLKGPVNSRVNERVISIFVAANGLVTWPVRRHHLVVDELYERCGDAEY